MTAIRWRFPVGSLRGTAVMAKLLALAAVAVAATLLRAPLHLGALYPLKASILFSVMMALAIGFLDAHHPFTRYGVANQITTVRAALVALMGSLIGEETTPIVGMGAAITGAVTILLDGVDGWVARRTEMQSRFGARYDMEIDALLILVLAALAWKLEKAGAWVLLSGLIRYLFVGAGWMAAWLQQPLPYSRRRQTICAVQIVALAVALVPAVHSRVSSVVAALALLTLTYSFLVDIVWLWKHRPEPSPAPGSRAPVWLGLGAALLVLNASITFVNVWPTPMIRWNGRGSFELAICVLVLLALHRWRGGLPRRVVTWLAVVWMILAAGRYVSITAPALWGREINFYWDVRFVPDVASMLVRAAPIWLVVTALVSVVILLSGAFALIRRAFTELTLSIRLPAARTALLVLALATVAVFAAQSLFRPVPIDPYDVEPEPYVAEPVTQSFARQVKLAVKSVRGAQSLPAGPAFGSDFDLVRGADVLLVFIESYGAATFDRPEMAARLSGPRAAFEGAARASGRDVVSAFVESPTFGGSSWFAHLTLLSGIEIRDPDTNAMLMANERDTLVTAFSRNGYRTVALMPGLWYRWPEGAFYRFDEVIGAEKLAYHGPPYGWWTIPDQFSLAWVDEHELPARSRPPVFLFYPTVNTHIPFTPTPPYQADWARMLKPHPFDTPDLLRSYDETLDWLNLGPSYVNAVSYTYAVLGSYLTRRADRDFVMILIGDHQPPAVISGEGTSWDVPVHVITNRPAVLDRLLARGFHRGINPPRARIATMHGLLPTLLDSFSSHTKPPPAIAAQ